MSTVLVQGGFVRAGVGVIPMRWNIAKMDAEILFIQRKGSHGAGTWTVPGGWMEFGETSRDAALRECEEETGLKATYLKEAGYTEDFFADEGKHCITLWHRVIVPADAEPVMTEPDKVAEFRWVVPMGPLPQPLFLPLQHFLDQGHTL